MTNQPGLKVIVEGPSDAQIVRAIVGKELASRLRVFAPQGLASLATVGRNVLVHEGGPVLLVMDSDTLDPQLTAELQAMNMVAMSGAITPGAAPPVFPDSPASQFKVFTFVPEIEAVFFEAPQALDRLLGEEPPQGKVKSGQFAPRQTLLDLLDHAGSHRDYQAQLADLDPLPGVTVHGPRVTKVQRQRGRGRAYPS
jgi:hypothetical protein